jgi:hypothetical protein
MSWNVLSSRMRSQSASRVASPAMCELLESRQLLSTTLPAGFTETDIGNVGKPGSTSYDASTGTFTITGGGNYGTDFFSTADAAHFVYVPITGNGMITVQVESITANDATTPSGIAIRDSLSPSAAEDFLGLRPDQHLIENVRTSDGGTADNLYVSPSVVPQYLRLVRSGNTVSSYSSTDGVNFSLDHTDTISGFGATVYAGLVVSSSNPAYTSTAVFNNVSVSSLTATLTNAPTDTLPNASAYQFSVTYASPNNVAAASIGNSNLVVTGPGYSQDATLVSTGLTNAPTVVATYSVPALTSAGTYTISEGASPATDTTGAIAGSPVGTFYAVTQGQTSQYTITGKVVSSLNPTIGVANRVVYIDANDSGSFTGGDVTATTDSGGNFTLTGLLPGTYRVEEELPGGVTQSDPILGYDTATLTPTTPTAAVSFSEFPASLAGGSGGPNLTASLIGQPNAVLAGSKGKEKITIKNTGTATASGPIVVSLLLSPTGTLTAQDTVIDSIAEPKNFSLKPGKSKTINVNFTYPSVTTDAYRLVAVADSTNLITTTNQSNKAAFSNIIQISSAFTYLAVTFATQPPAALALGKSGTVTLTVNNIGNANSNGAFTLGLYASTDQTLSSDDVLVGKLTKSGIKANQSKAYKVKFTIPKTLPVGSYYIVAGLTSASNNNASSSSATVAVS